MFSTKDHATVLSEPRREEFFRYVWGIHQRLHCHLYRINAMDDHMHILTSLHPSLALADYKRELKTGTGRWIKDQQIHHQHTDYLGEYRCMLNEARIKHDDKYLV